MKHYMCKDCGQDIRLSKYERYASIKREHKPSLKFHPPFSSIGKIGLGNVLDRITEILYTGK